MNQMGKRQLLCILLGITAAGFTFFVDKQSAVLPDGVCLERASYGQGERKQELLVEGLCEDPVEVDLLLGEREYDEEEALRALEQAGEDLKKQILGENRTLSEVRSRLNLMTWLEGSGISVEWEAEDPNLVGRDGEINPAGCLETGTRTSLTAYLTAGEYTGEYRYQLVLFPPVQTEKEALQERFLHALEEMEQAQRSSDHFLLPGEYEGKKLLYHRKQDSDALLFAGLGLGAALLLPVWEREREKERRKKTERQMMLAYSEILSKLAVYSGAGLPVRAAWERIVFEYESEKKRQENASPAYEEMAAAYYQMQRGVPEIRAYAEFGEHCRLLPYRRLAGILEQNVRKGSQKLQLLLETEMETAFEERKELARRMGEEASTRLLLPLFLMLSIVMVMVSVPAFLSFVF